PLGPAIAPYVAPHQRALLRTHHAPHHPHSSPTRRSSDLREGPAAPRSDRGLRPRSRRAGRALARAAILVPQIPPRLRRRRANVRDRKSTRLNSSHRTTSYAVFCLKKKKLAPTA